MLAQGARASLAWACEGWEGDRAIELVGVRTGWVMTLGG